MIVVIPSAREINFEYLKPLIEADARFIIVDDTEGSIDIDHPQFSVFNWSHRRSILGKYDDYVPRRNGASRSFGFFLAWKESDADELIIALDDDCLVPHYDFKSRLESVMSKKKRKVASGDGMHFNILDAYEDIEEHVYPRGFPYAARVDYKPWSFFTEVETDSRFNLGLWSNVFDVNGIDKIKGPKYSYPDVSLKSELILVPKGALVSACSMNMHFRRELIPAIYQLPMHVDIMPGWKIDRYGDIWGGFILKTLMDIKGDNFTVGAPMITHLKEGNFQNNIWQEHLSHLVNEEFLVILTDASTQIISSDYLDMMTQLNEIFKKRTESSSPILSRYLKYLTQAIDVWCLLLRNC